MGCRAGAYGPRWRETLNDLGRLGWEVCGVVNLDLDGKGAHQHFVYKRKIGDYVPSKELSLSILVHNTPLMGQIL